MMHQQPSQGTVNLNDPSYMGHGNPASSDYLVADQQMPPTISASQNFSDKY